jgi:hypothetical protein
MFNLEQALKEIEPFIQALYDYNNIDREVQDDA